VPKCNYTNILTKPADRVDSQSRYNPRPTKIGDVQHNTVRFRAKLPNNTD